MADITSGLVGWWKFDEGAGTSATDSSGSGNTGTLNGSVTWVTGKIQKGVEFNGSKGNYVSVADSTSLDITGAVTIAAWVYIDTQPPGSSNGAFPRILQKDTTANHAYGLWIDSTGGNTTKPTIRVRISSTNYDLRSDNNLSLQTWHHVVGVREGAALRLYVNGTLDKENTSAATTGSLDNTGQLQMSESTGNSDGCLDGILDDVRVYNRALSASDVTELFNYPFGRPHNMIRVIKVSNGMSRNELSS